MTDQLKPGRELDALIAQKVTKKVPCSQWRYMSFGSAGGPAAVNEGCDHEMGGCFPAPGSVNIELLEGPPHYSTNIAAAWELVDKVGLEVGPTSDVKGERDGWFAEKPGKIISYSKAETAPHAICLAALKVVGEKS